MASFAKIGLNNKVIEILSVHNNELKDSNGVEQEVNGIDFLTTFNRLGYLETNIYNTLADGTRKNYAGIGYTYDEDRDAFISPKPFASWTLNETTCKWEAPVNRPNDDNIYDWNETSNNWEIVE